MKISVGLNTLIQTALLAASLFATQNAAAQGTRSDYERALNLKKNTANKVFKSRVAAHWLPGNTQFWYRNDLSEERREFILVNAETGVRRPAFDHKRLAAELSKDTGEEIQADRLPIDKLEFSKSGSELLFRSQGKRWNCDLQNYEIQEVPREEQAITSLEPLGRLRDGPHADQHAKCNQARSNAHSQVSLLLYSRRLPAERIRAVHAKHSTSNHARCVLIGTTLLRTDAFRVTVWNSDFRLFFSAGRQTEV